MRLLMIIAVVLFAIALVCFLVPTAVAGASGLAWVAGGLLVWAFDIAIGGYITPVAVRRQSQ